MEFDSERYRTEVLDPARKRGNVPPADLFVRYAVGPAARSDDSAFAAHVEDMAKHWRALKQKHVYGKIAEALLGCHAELAGAGELTRAGFEERLRADRARDLPRLEQGIRVLADGSPCISRSWLDALVDTFGGLWDEQAVAAVVRRLEIEVIDQPWELPAVPAGNKHKDLAANLAALGLRLSIELVFGAKPVRQGFRLRGGFRMISDATAVLSEGEIQRARSSLAERAQDERKTAKDNVLTILLNAARAADGVEALLVWELAEILQPLVSNRLPVRTIAGEAVRRGLDAREAHELAVALVEASSVRPTGPDPAVAGVHEALATGVREALAAGELRTAERLAASLPAGTEPELQRQVAEAVTRVDALIDRAERSLAGGESEAAAELLALAAAGASDDEELRRRLQAIAPPPPARVRASVDDRGRVVVAWARSPVRTGTPRYRVVRSLDSPARAAAHGERIGETDRHEVTDPAPPAGEEVVYTVFASRGAEVWSEPAAADPVLLTPEVVDAEVACDARSVTGSWRVPAGVAVVEVVRGTGAPPMPASEAEPVPAEHTRFVDDRVRAGVRYYYRIHTVYFGRGGTRRVSAGVILCAVPQARLAPVDDLRAEVLPGDSFSPHDAPCGVLLSWTPPPAGTVSLRIATTYPPWPDGSAVPLAEVAGHGALVPGVPEAARDGRMALRTAADTGRRFVTPITGGAETAVVGATVVLTLVGPVRRLRYRRLGEQVRLSWEWPPDASVCRVRWRPSGAGGTGGAGAGAGAGGTGGPGVGVSQRDCTLRGYEDGGGFKIVAGPGGLSVSVQALVRDIGGEITASPVTLEVPADPVSVRYSFHRPRMPWPKHRVRLVLTCDRTCLLPALVVVHSAERVLPLSAGQGRRVGAVPAQRISPSAPLVVDLAVPGAHRGSGWLVCFVEDGASGDVVLVRGERAR